MSKVNFDSLIEMLSEYDEGELSDWSQMYLKDELLYVSEKLYREEITEGHVFESMMILVEKGAEIPQPYKEFVMKSTLTDNPLKIKIMEITKIEQSDNGNLIIEVLARKIR